jgi:hypothetical protein
MMATMDALPPDALLDDFPPPMQAIAQRLRSIVVATEPTVVERVRPGWRLIGYDLPMGRRSVYFAWISPEAAHVHLGFPAGWVMRDPLRELQGAGITKRARWLTFRAGDPIPAERCAALVREAIQVATMSPDERMLRSMDAEATSAADDA